MNAIYLTKRLIIAIFSIFIVTTLVFAITHVLPGSAADMLLGMGATEDSVRQLEERFGLDRPLSVQYVDFIGGLLVLDFGQSFVSGQPVTEILTPPFLRTLQLALVAMVMSTALAIPAGVVAATKRETKLDSLITTTGYIGVSLPEFISASLLLLLFASPPLDLFPSGGYTPFTESVIGWLSHLILPALALSTVVFAYVMRQTRSSMIETLESDYIRTARLKGVKEFDVLFKHALRNGLLPTLTVLAFNVGWMMGAVVVVEVIFDYPGIGTALVDAINSRDLPVLQAAVLIPTTAYIFANLIADILYTVIDPRIEMGDK